MVVLQAWLFSCFLASIWGDFPPQTPLRKEFHAISFFFKICTLLAEENITQAILFSIFF